MKTPFTQPKRTLFILLLLSACSLLITCDKSERNNPWDEKANPNDWAPQNVEYVVNSETSITISWDYTAILPEGFKIDRKEGDANWHNEYAVFDNYMWSLTDTSVNLYDYKYQYRVYAYAGENKSAYSETDLIGAVVDIDGNVYQTVIIGDQEWMAENIRVTSYNNGDAITTGLSNAEWGNTTSGAYAIYNNDNNMLEAYGKLYNWYAVGDPRGLCPEGWSVPSDADWTALVSYVADQGFPNSNVVNGAANALKSCRQVGSPLGGDCDTSEHPRWNSHSTHYGFDEFGFSALPGGYRNAYGSFDLLGTYGRWWSSTEASSTYAWYRSMTRSYGGVYRGYYDKTRGFSLRCVRDL